MNEIRDERPREPDRSWTDQLIHLTWKFRSSKAVALVLIVLAVVAVYLLVYATGGIKYVYSHSMYIPILLAGFVFGVPGGLIAGLGGGLVLGPFMPIDVALGEPQEMTHWVFRTAFFVLIGFLNAAAVRTIERRLKHSEWMARHNTDTGLPNRTKMLEALSEMNGGSSDAALFIVSASNLNEINAAFGVEAGDSIMRQMAERLQKTVPPPVSIFQHHPEQLGLIVRNVKHKRLKAEIAKIEDEMKNPFACSDVLLHVEPHIGYVPSDMLDGSPVVQLRRAELAINHARENDLDHHVYAPQLDGSARENMKILGLLKRGIEDNQLCLHYQPKVRISDRRLTGVEALVRWNSPGKGLIAPGLFIPQAEQSSLIHPLTEWVLNNALSDLAGWIDQGVDVTLAINISTRNLAHPAFQSAVIQALERHNVAAEHLELEVTETAVMRDPGRAASLLERLSDSRIVISIDDFGVGHSSLAYLSRLPASSLKIDQAFIRKLRPFSGEAHIVDAAIHLAHALNMQVVGEGVETEESYRLLGEKGCDIAQGFHIGRPMPAGELMGWIHRYQDNPEPGSQRN